MGYSRWDDDPDERGRSQRPRSRDGGSRDNDRGYDRDQRSSRDGSRGQRPDPRGGRPPRDDYPGGSGGAGGSRRPDRDERGYRQPTQRYGGRGDDAPLDDRRSGRGPGGGHRSPGDSDRYGRGASVGRGRGGESLRSGMMDHGGRTARPPAREYGAPGRGGGLWGDDEGGPMGQPLGPGGSARYIPGARGNARGGRYGAGTDADAPKGSRLATVAMGFGACILAAVLGVGSAVGLYVARSHGSSNPAPAATHPATTAPASGTGTPTHATPSPTGK